jgi:putative transposase
MKEWFTAAELAELKLPSLPTTERAFQIRAKREKWAFRKREGRGGGREYPLSALPKAALDKYVQRELINSMPTVKEEKPKEYKDFADLKSWQRQVAESRMAVLAEVDRLSMCNGTTLSVAIDALIETVRNNELSPYFTEIIEKANAKRGKKSRTLSRRTVYYWLSQVEKGGISALAPEPGRKEFVGVPDWFDDFAKLYFRPQKPSINSCVEMMQKHYKNAPNYYQVRWFLNKMSPVLINQNRMGKRAIKAISAYVERTIDNLWPSAVYSADGHTFDAEVAHPIHGQPFRPEITGVIDIYSRKLVGWSVALSESAISVTDALRHACMTNGVPAIWYIDNGKGFNNKSLDLFIARLGITKQNGLPYNSQARGVIERSHQSIWVKAAKLLPTYMGAAMDSEAAQKAFKVTRKAIKNGEISKILPSWEFFLEFCNQAVNEYNNRPHSSLPKIFDETLGQQRHMTPSEVFDKGNIERPEFNPEIIHPSSCDDLFRPYEKRMVRRARVELFTNTYGHDLLNHYHEKYVAVGYDIHDAGKVWVRELDKDEMPSRLICVASFEYNKREYFPTSVIEQAAEKRVKNKVKRLKAHVETALLENAKPSLFAPKASPISEEEARLTAQIEAEFEAKLEERNSAEIITINKKQRDFARAYKIDEKLAKGEFVSPEDKQWFDGYSRQPEYRSGKGIADDFGIGAVLDALSA